MSRSHTPDVSRAARGRYLARHHARVIEQDDLLVVEFVDSEPWYTRAAAEAERERKAARTFSISLLGFGAASSGLSVAHLFGWI
jgi:hypothetical protein